MGRGPRSGWRRLAALPARILNALAAALIVVFVAAIGLQLTPWPLPLPWWVAGYDLAASFGSTALAGVVAAYGGALALAWRRSGQACRDDSERLLPARIRRVFDGGAPEPGSVEDFLLALGVLHLVLTIIFSALA